MDAAHQTRSEPETLADRAVAGAMRTRRPVRPEVGPCDSGRYRTCSTV